MPPRFYPSIGRCAAAWPFLSTPQAARPKQHTATCNRTAYGHTAHISLYFIKNPQPFAASGILLVHLHSLNAHRHIRHIPILSRRRIFHENSLCVHDRGCLGFPECKESVFVLSSFSCTPGATALPLRFAIIDHRPFAHGSRRRTKKMINRKLPINLHL